MASQVSYVDSSGQHVQYELWGKLPNNRSSMITGLEQEWLDLTQQKNLDRWGQYIDELNSLHFRSNEFVTEHDGYHVVFLGDSNTFGEGLEVDETWTKIVYEHINSKVGCSGYFNLAMPGRSIPDMISNLYRYMRTYGTPDAIFINLTEFVRSYGFDRVNQWPCTVRYSQGNLKPLELLAHDYYMMLEDYCRHLCIMLVSFTWDTSPDNDEKTTQDLFLESGFKTFVEIKQDDLIMYLVNNSGKDVYFMKAREGAY